MKPSEFGKIVKLTKRYIEDERFWGNTEILLEKLPDRPKPLKKADMKSCAQQLNEFYYKICNCTKCPLGFTRIKFVFGTGNPNAKLMFIGEGPGYEEDHTGEPFVGRAGQLLTKIIESIGLKREEVYITNLVKCHPMIDPSDPQKKGNDRPPKPEEIDACHNYLLKQIDI